MKKPMGKGWLKRTKKAISKADGGWMKLEPDKEEKPGILESAYLGLKKGATGNWNDEIEGVLGASGMPKSAYTLNPIMQLPAAALGAGKMLLSDDGYKQYEEHRDAARKRQAEAEKENPITSGVSELGGALLLPTGKIGAVGKAAATGAGYGLASGLGEGEGLTDSLVKGGVGTLVGGAIGAAAKPIADGIGSAANWVGEKFSKATAPARRMTNPDQEALPHFLGKMKNDVETGGTLTQEELNYARKYGLPVLGGDLGGEEVQSLARLAGDTSPKALGKMNAVLNERHADEGKRLAAGIENLTLAPNSRTALAKLRQESGIVSDEAYEAAMLQGDNGVSSPTIDRIMQNPPKVISDIVARAGENFKTLQASGMAKKGMHVGEDGVARPTLEFMDQVKKEFDAVISAAIDAKDKPRAASLTAIKNKMVGELDELIPDYKKARGIFADFMGVDNAAQAGRKMYQMADNPNLYDQKFMKALEASSSAERGMLASGYLTAMIDKVRTTPDARLVANQILKSPQSREVAEKILGTRKLGELQMMIKLEKVAGRLREAVQGNSKTSRFQQAREAVQAELGWAGAGIGVGTLISGNPLDPWNIVTGAAGSISKRGRDKFLAKSKEKWANKIAEYITTNDMSKLRQAAQQMSASPWAKRDVSKTMERVAKVGGQQAPNAASPLKIIVGPKTVPADEDQENKNWQRIK
jgi:hypothetical protein